MKRILVAGIIVMLAAGTAMAAKDKVAQDAPPAPTKQELVWEKKYLEERFNALQANIRLAQQEIAAVSARYAEVESQIEAIEEQEKPKGKPKGKGK